DTHGARGEWRVEIRSFRAWIRRHNATCQEPHSSPPEPQAAAAPPDGSQTGLGGQRRPRAGHVGVTP
ncbi:hypothetical protein M0638_25145, partial [Roseomonas sp. NAR14]